MYFHVNSELVKTIIKYNLYDQHEVIMDKKEILDVVFYED